MKPTRLLLALAMVALLAALVLWRAGSNPSAPESAGPVDTSAEPAEAATTGKQVSSTEPARVEVTEAPAQAPAVEGPANGHLLRGRVVVIEPDGRESHDADGRFVLGVYRRDSAGRAEEVRFVDGAFEHRIDDPDSFDGVSVESLRVGDRPAVLEEPIGRVRAGLDSELVVRARLSPPTVLRVVDAESGVDLDGVALVRPGRLLREMTTHPGSEYAERLIAQGLTSPVDLDRFGAQLELFGQGRALIGASGHAWTLLELDLQHGGERVVALERGADLAVLVRGVDAEAGSVLRVYSPDRQMPLAEDDLEQDALHELVGLAPGPYRVAAELGEWFRAPKVLAEAQTELEAGRRVELDLVLDAPPALELARAGGTLLIAQDWKPRSLQVDLELLDTPLEGAQRRFLLLPDPVDSQRDGFAAFRWTQEGLQVGRYALGIRKPPFSVTLEVPSGGRDDLDVVVPAPVELSVQLVDAVTGEDVVTDQLQWFLHRSVEEMRAGQQVFAENVRQAPDGRGYVIVAPAVEIDLMLYHWGYQAYRETLDLGRGVREHTVRLQPGCGLTLKLVDGETPIAFPGDWYGEVSATGGEGQPTLTQLDTFERRFMVSQPGTYTILPPTLPGYEPPTLQTVEVLPGEFTDVVVELEREH